MADLQDPEEDMLPEALTGKASRLRKMASILRQVQGPATAANTMVGRHYIAPTTAQMLNPAVSMLRGHLADNQATDLEQQAAQMQRQQRQQFVQGMPQAQPGLPERPLMGPVDPEGGVPALGNAPPQAPQPVTRDMVLKHTLSGMQNPATAGMAKSYGDMALKGIDAQDQRDFRASESEAQRQMRMDEGEANRQARMDALKEQIASREKLGADTKDMRLALGQMQADAQRYAADRRFDAASLRASMAKEKGVGGKPLPTAAHKELTELENTAGNIAGLNATFKDEYSTPLQGAKNTVNAFNPFAKQTDANVWWKNYSKQSSLEEAHRLFGAAFTDAEQARWKAADISPGMNPKLIRANLAIREQIAKRMFGNAVDRYTLEGHSSASRAYNPDAPRSTGVEGTKKTADDYLKLYGATPAQ